MRTIQKMRGALASLCGLILLAGCSGAQKAEAPTSVAAIAEVSTESAAPKSAKSGAPQIQWASSFEAARDEAKEKNKPLMIDFYTDWCSACKFLDAKIYPDKDVVKASRDFINVKVNAEKRTDIAEQYGVTAFPTLIWIRADGMPVYRQDGANSNPADFVSQLKKARDRFAAVKK